MPTRPSLFFIFQQVEPKKKKATQSNEVQMSWNFAHTFQRMMRRCTWKFNSKRSNLDHQIWKLSQIGVFTRDFHERSIWGFSWEIYWRQSLGMFLKCHRTQEVTKIDFKKGRVLGRGSKRIEFWVQDTVYISSKGPKDIKNVPKVRLRSSMKNFKNDH